MPTPYISRYLSDLPRTTIHGHCENLVLLLTVQLGLHQYIRKSEERCGYFTLGVRTKSQLYRLTSGSCLLLSGSIADVVGPRPVNLIGCFLAG